LFRWAWNCSKTKKESKNLNNLGSSLVLYEVDAHDNEDDGSHSHRDNDDQMFAFFANLTAEEHVYAKTQ